MQIRADFPVSTAFACGSDSGTPFSRGCVGHAYCMFVLFMSFFCSSLLFYALHAAAEIHHFVPILQTTHRCVWVCLCVCLLVPPRKPASGRCLIFHHKLSTTHRAAPLFLFALLLCLQRSICGVYIRTQHCQIIIDQCSPHTRKKIPMYTHARTEKKKLFNTREKGHSVTT